MYDFHDNNCIVSQEDASCMNWKLPDQVGSVGVLSVCR